MSTKSTKPTYHMSCLAYGPTYGQLWLNQHVASLLDESNLPWLKQNYDLKYHLVTDQETYLMLNRQPNFLRLSELCDIDVDKLEWPPDQNQYELRYHVLMQTFEMTVEEALKRGGLCSAFCADHVFAKDFFPRVIGRIQEGHDAVFMMPFRSTYEPMKKRLSKYAYALRDVDLFDHAYACMHPLWTACHWDAPQFTKLPFSLLWNNGRGVLARNFCTTPICFKPNAELLKCEGVIDRKMPAMFKNPFWANDWTAAPCVELAPLVCYYPPFANHRASPEGIAGWANTKVPAEAGGHYTLDSTQVEYASQRCFYPSAALAAFDEKTVLISDLLTTETMDAIKGGRK